MSKDQTSIIKNLLEVTPPGEYDLAFRDLQIICQNTSIPSIPQNTRLTWLEKKYTPVKIDDHYAIICKEARVSNLGEYIDPVTFQLFTITLDPLVVQKNESVAQAQNSPTRQQYQDTFSKYVKTAYNSEAAAGVYPKADGFSIILVGVSVNLKNFRTGSVIGNYSIENEKVNGKISSIQHFYESGNAICEHISKISATFQPGDANDLLNCISEFESSWLSSLTQTLDRIFSTEMNKLRRKLPVTATKINWEAELRGVGGMGGY